MHDSDDMDPGWAYHDAAAVLVEEGSWRPSRRNG
jgi:hypothetical protein